MPGSVGGELLPALCKHSGKRCPEDFGLCYNPGFIALGSVVRDMLKPDMILIGESDAPWDASRPSNRRRPARWAGAISMANRRGPMKR
jgi:hypothetical protein